MVLKAVKDAQHDAGDCSFWSNGAKPGGVLQRRRGNDCTTDVRVVALSGMRHILQIKTV